MKKQLKATFSGMVQGVGFRFTVERLSRGFQVNGYVRNLPNGKVELLAEGEESVILDFLKALESEMKEYIQNKDVTWSESGDHFKNFRIAY